MIRTPSAGHSDCIISMRLSLRKQQHATLSRVFAPTLQAEPVENDKFYLDLHGLLQSTSADNKVIIFGDFNVRVANTALESATTAGACCWNFSLNSYMALRTPSSTTKTSKKTILTTAGMILVPNIGSSSTILVR